MSPDSVLLIRPDLALVEVDDEIVLYDDSERRLHRLNPTAATLWRCIDGIGSLAEIAKDIADVYQTDREGVLADVLQLARQFALEGLVVGQPDDSVPWR
jgi:hypothetical protein